MLHSLWHWRPCRRLHAARSRPAWPATVSCPPQTCRASRKLVVSRSQVPQLHRQGCAELRPPTEACSTTAVGVHVKTCAASSCTAQGHGHLLQLRHTPATTLQLDLDASMAAPLQSSGRAEQRPHLAAAAEDPPGSSKLQMRAQLPLESMTALQPSSTARAAS